MNVIRLGDVARCRSGDKGNHANLGVIALDPCDYDKLRKFLTADVVADAAKHLGVSKVERFELPNIFSLNFLLYDALGGGASRSLRTDTQGKLIGTEALEWRIPWDPLEAISP
mgnify:CR=1 FL=1|jgi:hypothetical protein